MSEFKIDKIDQKIIEILKKDCRTPYSRIAKELLTSPEKIKFRIQRLMDNKIINCFKLELNLDFLDFIEYNVLIKLVKHDKDHYEKFVNALLNHPYVKWVATSSGEWDFRIILVARNSHQLKLAVEELESVCFFKKLMVLTRLYKEEKKLGMKLLKNQYERSHNKVSYVDERKFKISAFDKKDWLLLKELVINPRAQFKELSEKIGISAENARYRINKVLNSEIVHALTLSLNTIPSNTSWDLAYLKINSPVRKKLRDYLLTRDEVQNVHHVLGEWDLELTLNFKSIHNKKEFFDDLDREFYGTIIEVDTIELYDNLKFPQVAMGIIDELIEYLE